MSENKFETVSSLVDNYQSGTDKLDDVLNDELLTQKWENYHLIGDAMRDELPSNVELDLSSAISDAIANEPTILAPKTRPSIGEQVKAKVVQFAKPFGQVAIAASAAGLMVLGVQQNVVENDTAIPSPQVVQTIPFGGVADPVSFNYQTPSKASQKQAYIEQQRRFQALLADHNQQVKLSSINNSQNSAQSTEQDKVEDTPQ